jgi:hypothetical protein
MRDWLTDLGLAAFGMASPDVRVLVEIKGPGLQEKHCPDGGDVEEIEQRSTS